MLCPFIGKICHVYLDNIIAQSTLVAEHLRNMESILKVVLEHSMYCLPKKTDLFCTKLRFLGHIISMRGIEADPKKIEAIKK